MNHWRGSMFKLIISLVFIFNMSLQAQTVESQGQALYQPVTCPQISSDISDALTTLKSFSASTFAEAGCEGVSEATTRLTSLVSNKHKATFQKIIQKKGKMLSAKEAEAIESYSSEVTQLVGDVLNLAGSSDCPVSKKKKSVLFRSLLNLSFDAIEGVSQMVGPYGAPVSLGVNILKGVMSGFGNFKNKNSGYNFSVTKEGREQAVLYTKSLCIYHNFKKEADVLLNESERVASYRKLQDELDRKINTLLAPNFCVGCAMIYEVFEGDDDSVSVEGIAMSEIVKSVDDNNGRFLGSHLLDALQTRRWLQSQFQKLDINLDTFNESIGPALLGIELEEIEEFLVDIESVQFMNWLNDEARNAYNNFSSKAKKAWVSAAKNDLEVMRMGTGRRGFGFSRKKSLGIQPSLSVRSIDNFVSLYDFKEYLLSVKDQLPKYSIFRDEFYLNSVYKRSINSIKGVGRFLNAQNEYCNFFRSAGFYGPVYGACNNQGLAKVSDVFYAETEADPSVAGWLKNITSVGNYSDVKVTNHEAWADHLNDLFDKWNYVQGQHMLSIIAK